MAKFTATAIKELDERGKLDMTALVVMSGGQDSTTCLFYSLRCYQRVQAISFHYGQNNSIELEFASKICRDQKVQHKVVQLDFFNTLSSSALLDNGDVDELNQKGFLNSFVPNRNQIFLTLAHTYAQEIGASRVITGVCQTNFVETDYKEGTKGSATRKALDRLGNMSGEFPDCRPNFIQSLEDVTNMGSVSSIEFIAPLMYLSKAKIFKLAEDLGIMDIILKDTMTCHYGTHVENVWGFGCGKCTTCISRKYGWEEYKS